MKRAIFLGVAMLFSACVSKQVVANNNCPNVIFIDEALQKNLVCKELTNKNPNNLVIEIQLLNSSKKEINLEAKQSFFDSNGMHIANLKMINQKLNLKAHESGFLRFGAPNNTNFYKIEIIKPK